MAKKQNANSGAKKLIVMLSEKGGDGKTTFSKALTDFLRRGFVYDQDGAPTLDGAGVPLVVKSRVLVSDCNPKVGQLADAYGLKDANGAYDAMANLQKPFEGVFTLDIKDKTKCGQLLDYIDTEADHIVLDMPGGSITDVSSVFGTVDDFIAEYQGAGYEVVVIMVISHLIASAKNIDPIMTAWKKADRFVVVKNEGRAPADKFIFFDGEHKKKAGDPVARLGLAGGQVILMPKIEDDTYALFDAEQIPISTAANPELSPFGRQDRGRMRNFMAKCDAEIAKLNLA